MSRGVDATLLAETVKAGLYPIFLFEFEANSGWVRAWTGIGTLTWGGNDYLGTGTFGSFSPAEEGIDGGAIGMTYTLSGVDDANVAVAVADIRPDKVATLYFSAMNSEGQIVGTPEPVAVHFTDVPSIQDNGDTCAIALTAESAAIDQLRPRVRRFTTEDQKIDDATDLGFEYVEGLQMRTLTWGRS